MLSLNSQTDYENMSDDDNPENTKYIIWECMFDTPIKRVLICVRLEIDSAQFSDHKDTRIVLIC